MCFLDCAKIIIRKKKSNPVAKELRNLKYKQRTITNKKIYVLFATITLDLRVNPIPSPATPEPIEVCDEDNDGFTFFDVQTYQAEIINGELDITLSYYETLANAQNAVEPLVSPYFNIVPMKMTVVMLLRLVIQMLIKMDY